MHTRSCRTRDQRGSALVELLLVVTILAILFGIVVFAVSGFTDKAPTTSSATDAQALRAAVEEYHAKSGPAATPTEQQLVNARLLDTVSSLHDPLYSGDGVVTVASVAPC